MSRLAVIIPAAGSGSRMGTHTPKPFLTLNGKTILEHTISAFAKVDEVVDIRIATSVDWFDQVEAILNKFADDVESASVIEGGDERQHSIFNALQSLDNSIDLIAVHDAVRPFVSAELIRKCAHRASEVGGAIVAVPAKDTIKKLGDGFEISETPDRSKLWQAQTPQDKAQQPEQSLRKRETHSFGPSQAPAQTKPHSARRRRAQATKDVELRQRRRRAARADAGAEFFAGGARRRRRRGHARRKAAAAAADRRRKQQRLVRRRRAPVQAPAPKKGRAGQETTAAAVLLE